MEDHDRDREHIRETDRTTIVDAGGGRRRGGSGALIAVALILAVLALLYFLFAGNINQAADEVGVNVNLETPDVKMPDVNLPNVDVNVPEKIEVDVPEVEVKSDGNESR